MGKFRSKYKWRERAGFQRNIEQILKTRPYNTSPTWPVDPPPSKYKIDYWAGQWGVTIIQFTRPLGSDLIRMKLSPILFPLNLGGPEKDAL